MENKQRTPLALAIHHIDKIKKNVTNVNEKNDLQNIVDFLKSLKQKEREMLESFYIQGCKNTILYDSHENKAKKYFDLSLTQE